MATDMGSWYEATLLNAVTADTTSDAVTIDTVRFHTLRVIVDITTTANVVIEGRLTTVANWVPLNTPVTTDGAIVVDALPQVRAKSTSVSGALTVAIRGDRGR